MTSARPTAMPKKTTTVPEASFISRRIDSATLVLVGLALFIGIMSWYAVVAFAQFSPLQVLSAGACYVVLFVGIAYVLCPPVRRVRLRPTLPSVLLGLVLALVLLVLAFTWVTQPGPIWTDYFPPFPLVQLAHGSGFHQDAVFHVSLIQGILTFGYPTTGQNDVPFVPYHVLSHYIDALVLWLTQLQPYDSYGLSFHFKVVIFLSSIVVFIWVITRKRGIVAFALTFLFLAPVLLSTWIGIGSHAQWSTSLILILGAPFIYDLLRTPRLRSGNIATLFALGVAVGLGKVSSGVMFVALISLVLVLKFPRRVLPYALIAAWLAFFAIYWRLFNTGHSSGLQRPRVTGTLSFLNFFTTYGGAPIEWNLAAIYFMLVLLVVFAFVYRRTLTVQMAGATVGGVVALTVVTQVLAGLTQPDIFYFIFGLTVPVILLGVQVLLADLDRTVRLPSRLARIPAQAVRVVLIALMIVATAPLYKSTVNVFTMASPAIAESVAAANTGYFQRYNETVPPSGRVSMLGLVSGEERMDVGASAGGSASAFRTALQEFMVAEQLTARNSLLFIPKEIFQTSIAAYGGPSWARGMLVYALTGVPLIHGIEDNSIRAFGQSSYDETALQRDTVSGETCALGKQVIEITSWDPARFTTACASD